MYENCKRFFIDIDLHVFCFLIIVTVYFIFAGCLLQHRNKRQKVTYICTKTQTLSLGNKLAIANKEVKPNNAPTFSIFSNTSR